VTAISLAAHDDLMISSTGAQQGGRSQEQGRPAPAIASISV
jgi:hypothetical protein